MKTNCLRLLDNRYTWITLFVLASVFGRSPYPLFGLPLALRQRHIENLSSAKTTVLETQLENQSQAIHSFTGQLQELQEQQKQQAKQQEQMQAEQTRQKEMIDNRSKAMQSFTWQLQKQKKQQEKQQEQIKIQQTRHKEMRSEIDQLVNINHQLELQIDSLQQAARPVSSKIVPIKRQTLMAIDYANLDCAAKAIGIPINYEMLKRYINSRFGSLEARIYVGENDRKVNNKLWFKHLRDRGYSIITKEAILHGNSFKSNVDVDLAVDVLSDGFNFKNLVLCSGDGDFLPLVKKLQQRGVRVIVLNLPDRTNNILQNLADEYISLSDIASEITTDTGHLKKA
ncbi:MAG: NYN domain-containing protein [Oscillatoria sp. SIO1A7]|nr:NYN domain-containing protein [Oscillatoria sp. SIO1A7]